MAECPLVNPRKIVKLFNQNEIESKAVVINIRNCLSVYADFGDMNPFVEKLQPKSVEYKYTNVDSLTFEESEPITSKAYLCRLYGVSISTKIQSMSKLQIHQSNLSNIKLYDIILMTSGNFNCKIHGVDEAEMLVIELIDPVTNENMGTSMLEKYPKTFKKYDENIKTIY